jgi:hypothetical protein
MAEHMQYLTSLTLYPWSIRQDNEPDLSLLRDMGSGLWTVYGHDVGYNGPLECWKGLEKPPDVYECWQPRLSNAEVMIRTFVRRWFGEYDEL